MRRLARLERDRTKLKAGIQHVRYHVMLQVQFSPLPGLMRLKLSQQLATPLSAVLAAAKTYHRQLEAL